MEIFVIIVFTILAILGTYFRFRIKRKLKGMEQQVKSLRLFNRFDSIVTTIVFTIGAFVLIGWLFVFFLWL